MLRQQEAGKLVYCRFGKQYLQTLEKQAAYTTPVAQSSTAMKTASFLINVKKLIKEHNIESENGVSKLKTKSNVSKGND